MTERSIRARSRFYRKLRNISLTLAAISGSILAAPIALPALVIQVAGYIALAGTIAGGISQTKVKRRLTDDTP